MTACTGLCKAFAAGARKHPLAPISAPVEPFLRGVWKDRIFQVSVGHPGKQDRDPIHKSAEFDEFYGLF